MRENRSKKAGVEERELDMSKLKSSPEDFRVVEQTQFPINDGVFAVYRLKKRSIGTPEALQAICRAWDLKRNRVGYGGLKDKHALTEQTITIFRGHKTNLQERSFDLEYIGQSDRPFGPKDISGNHFEITLRKMSQTQLQRFVNAARNLVGVINYFDDQRFGSLSFSGEYIGAAWCRGDYQRALYLMLADANSFDGPTERQQKSILREHWGQWEECKQLLERSHRRSVVTFLVDHPTNFKKAVALVRKDLRSIYIAAFQSMLWNRWLDAILQSQVAAEQRMSWQSRIGILHGITGNPSEKAPWLPGLELCLPSARQKNWPENWKPLLDNIMQEFELTTEQIRLKYPRDTFFSKGNRKAWLPVTDVGAETITENDATSPSAVKLRFQLPPGSYATMIVKHLQIQSELS